MKFKIRFADQIVGLLIVVAIASLAFVIVMLGGSQRWFAHDVIFNSEFDSASGLSKNMPVLYKGFTIGNVKSFGLNEYDKVGVVLLIHEEFRDRVMFGSMVELIVSPIGLGSTFHFHPGRGMDLVEENGFIPSADSALGRSYIRQGLADDNRQDDNISVILANVGSIVAQLEEAMRIGSDSTEIGKIIGGVRETVAALPDQLDYTISTLVTDIDNLAEMIDTTLSLVNPILDDVGKITAMLTADDGIVSAVLDVNGDVYTSLVSSLDSISGILGELDTIAAFIPRQLPQIAGIIADLRITLKTAEDVLTGLANNPLLRGGIPEHVELQTTGTSPRNIRF